MTPLTQDQEAIAFWDRVHLDAGYPEDSDGRVRQALAAAQDFFPDVEGARVLDLGCGPGTTSIFWANKGAQVTALDYSTLAIEVLRRRAAQLKLTNIKAVAGNAMHIEELGRFDYIFGSMILHHIEPFRDFAAVLQRTLRPGGRAFFYENNAASDFLLWFRDHVVGRFGVPKMGDRDESPLAPHEIRVLREGFRVSVEYPEMFFFELAAPYLFGNHFRSPMQSVDRFLYRHRLGLQYSYRQYVKLDAPLSRG